MLEPTKRRPTDTVEIRFIGPAAAKDEAARLLKALGFESADDSIPWRDAVPFKEDQLPGACLAGARYREGFSQRKLADLTGIPQRHISEMENGKRPIGKERAKVLAKALGTDYRVFL
ncbi:MAG: XRE family transcriptional regulator [Deltaproteobacteria bacterium]|nr:MAG: XRE family transcriptional regulator [Deltaproteobacteria bacterium]